MNTRRSYAWSGQPRQAGCPGRIFRASLTQCRDRTITDPAHHAPAKALPRQRAGVLRPAEEPPLIARDIVAFLAILGRRDLRRRIVRATAAR